MDKISFYYLKDINLIKYLNIKENEMNKSNVIKLR